MKATPEDWKAVHEFLVRIGVDPGFTPGEAPSPMVVTYWGVQDPSAYNACWGVLRRAYRERLEREAEEESLTARLILDEMIVGYSDRR